MAGRYPAIDTDEGHLYLAGVLDLFLRRLVGWARDEPRPDDLTQEALEMALRHHLPPAEGCVLPNRLPIDQR